MKTVNKHIIALALVAGAMTGLTSCSDFLTEDPQTAVTEEHVLSNVETAEKSLSSVYEKYRSTFKDRHLWQVLVGTDEVQSGAYQVKSDVYHAALDQYDANLNSENGYVGSDQWDMRWPNLATAAKLVKAFEEGIDEAEADAKSIYGQASFLRGMFNIELALLFGPIPVIDMNTLAETGYGRRPLKEVWGIILRDFENAAKYCPETNVPGRATCYAGKMMQGYALMAAPEETGFRNFAKAAEVLKEVVDGPFSLVDYADLWDYNKPNTAESIFELQFSPTWPDNNQIQFQIGSRAAQSFWGDGCYYAGYDHAVPTEFAYSTKAEGGLWEDGDVRKEESIRYSFYNENEMEEPDLRYIQWEDLGDDYDELLPHIKKYEDFRTDSWSGEGINNMWNSGKNIPYLRLANAILLYAEALNETGKTADAVAQVNKVRSRANVAAWGTMSQEDFRTNIMDERMRELFAERWRKFDLLRTGKQVELVKARNKWQKRNGKIEEFHQYWPIPLSEIDQNLDINPEDQNPGYK